jgi:hypothetical protein
MVNKNISRFMKTLGLCARHIFSDPNLTLRTRLYLYFFIVQPFNPIELKVISCLFIIPNCLCCVSSSPPLITEPVAIGQVVQGRGLRRQHAMWLGHLQTVHQGDYDLFEQ